MSHCVEAALTVADLLLANGNGHTHRERSQQRGDAQELRHRVRVFREREIAPAEEVVAAVVKAVI